MFSILSQTYLTTWAMFHLSSANAFILDLSKNIWFGQGLLYTMQSQLLTTLGRITFLKTIVGKGENAENKLYLLCEQCFCHFLKANSIILVEINFLSIMISVWTSLKFCSLVNSTKDKI